MRTASLWYFCASVAMAFGTVAENISVRRVSRRLAENEFQILAEPEVEHLVGLVEHDGPQIAVMSSDPRWIWSRRRPGVPTTIWAPRSSARRSSRMSMPPTQEASVAPVCA